MGNNRPIKTKCWIKFLEFKNCKYISTEASHDKWKCPGCLRSIIHRQKDKEIPAFHINSNLITMGISKDEFLEWIKENC
ncbi:hypothetical protein [Pedobacter glucosidilyticus]|uniref:hypothetical protein n=1 Tax=Pedobacter glucosidilyticus TaxID=1122941 RepID=UPI0026EAF107|nr:hypothetical protein [Pedobacter glucosidilyticus]